MNILQVTFGCEFELLLPTSCPVQIGSYTRGSQVPGLPAGWVAKSDCSIQARTGYYGVEIVSPILRGADGLRQIKLVCDWLTAHGAKVNASTGFHVHVGFAGQSEETKSRLVHLVANFEQALFASTGTRSRENNRFCQSVQNHPSYVRRFRQRQAVGLNRYHVLNLTNIEYAGSTKPTVEFRCFAGTINATKAIGYVRLCLGLVEKSVTAKRKGKWIAKTTDETSPIKRSGDGQTQLTRLFYTLGWTKGRSKITFGDVPSEAGVPTIEANKRELMRLAKKYDRRAE